MMLRYTSLLLRLDNVEKVSVAPGLALDGDLLVTGLRTVFCRVLLSRIR